MPEPPFTTLDSRSGLLKKVLASGATDLNTALLNRSPCRKFSEHYHFEPLSCWIAQAFLLLLRT